MKSKFGILAKLNFLQNVLSNLIAKINPAVIHNLGKYFAIKKAFYLSSIEGISGNYYEFGVFTGSSFSHAIRCSKSYHKFDKKMGSMKFYGFDSFEGFGDLPEEEKHNFYTDNNFATNYDTVNNRINKVINSERYILEKGFFEDTLKIPAKGKCRIAFIDSDTYSSSKLALKYLANSIQEGTILILDDYYSYKGSLDRGVAGAVKEFCYENGITLREIADYGMGGVLMIISNDENAN